MGDVTFREAYRGDLPQILRLLADDMLGALREGAPGPAHAAAFAAVERDPNARLMVAEAEGAVVGCLQINFIAGLSRGGMLRGQIEAVRVAAGWRGQGLGQRLIGHAIAMCRARGCGMVQLTTDKRRGDAHRFYARLGFEASHEGMKLMLNGDTDAGS